jgi:hypothetical protein
MKTLSALPYLSLFLASVKGFVVTPTKTRLVPLFSTKTETQTLGLLTFDLDDTLYPIAPVEAEANEAFVDAMEQYGFKGLEPDDIVKTAKEIREEIGKVDPEKAAILTHTEVRELAIRREMEKATVAKRLQALADDEATTVDSLSKIVVESSEK